MEIVMRRLLLAVLATLALVAPASAQHYPSRPITIIVPFSAGGPSDEATLRSLTKGGGPGEIAGP